VASYDGPVKYSLHPRDRSPTNQPSKPQFIDIVSKFSLGLRIAGPQEFQAPTVFYIVAIYRQVKTKSRLPLLPS